MHSKRLIATQKASAKTRKTSKNKSKEQNKNKQTYRSSHKFGVKLPEPSGFGEQ